MPFSGDKNNEDGAIKFKCRLRKEKRERVQEKKRR